MVNLADFQITSPGPMVGFCYGEQVFENGCSVGLLFSDVSAGHVKAFWKAFGREEADWLEYWRDLDDDTTTVRMNHRLGELFPVWYLDRTEEANVGSTQILGARLIRESWDLSVSEEMIRLHYEREYQASPEPKAASEDSIVKKNRWRWSWAAFREWVRVAIDFAKAWMMN